MPSLSRRLPARSPLFFLTLAALALFALLACWPIVAFDTDLWYHLAAGRYIVTHEAIPREAYFSFLTPTRPWLDFYWLFQLIVYGFYAAAGYHGLVLLRAFLAALLCGLAGRFLLSGPLSKRLGYAWLLTSLYAVCLLPRLMNLRPHCFGYLFALLAIYLIERRKEWLAGLPFIALAWGNIHGASYPILLAILGAYTFEYFLDRFRTREAAEGPQSRTLAFLGLAMAAVFVTPLGGDLIEVPIVASQFCQRLINEYAPIQLADLFSIVVSRGGLVPDSASNALIVLSLLAAIAAVARRRARASHLILWLGGLFMLTKGVRFRYECALLALPMLATHYPFESPDVSIGALRPVRAMLAAMAALLIAFSFKAVLGERKRYPFSPALLPVGVVAYLNAVDAGGKVLNHSDVGGYLEWSLSARYRIALDMQIRFPFDERDLYESRMAWKDVHTLRRTLTRYRPDFILPLMGSREFSQVIKAFPDYVPVFFDDTAALYVDRRQHPDLARRDGLNVDPLNLPDAPRSDDKMAGPAPAYLARMIAVDPGCLKTRWRAAKYAAAARDFPAALAHAQAVIDVYPESHYGYLLKGEILGYQGSFDEALKTLARALKQAGPSKAEVYQAMAKVHSLHHEPAKANAALRLTQDPDLPPELWQ